MAHDIVFKDASGREETVFLFGYFEGIFYEAFDVKHFDMGVSGNGGVIEKSRDEVMEILNKIKDSKAIKDYPDPSRFQDFYKELSESSTVNFEIQFS